MNFRKHLESIGAGSHDAPASEAEISRVESLIATRLPADYRNYLLSLPSVRLPSSACIECTEPSPFGTAHFHSMHSISDVEDLLDSDLTPRNMITIATGNLNKYVCLSVSGLDHGSVYTSDGDYRCFWDDEEFQQAFSNMAESIRRYLEIRNREELPEKPFSYSTVYHVLAGHARPVVLAE